MEQEGGSGVLAKRQSEVAPLRNVLMKHPRDAFFNDLAIAEQWRQLGYGSRPDLERANEEMDFLVELLESLGAQVDFLPPHPETSLDSIYTRDASIITDRGIILCNMGKDQRAGEPSAQAETFEILELPILGAISGEGRLEGGDFLWLDEETAVVGRGYRTNPEGIRQLKGLLRATPGELVVVPLPHWKGPSDVFHLMSIMSPIDADLLLVFAPLLPIPFREFLLSRDITLVEVPSSEFESMGCNVLAVSPRVCVMLEGNPETRRRLEDAGAEVHLYRGDAISVPGMGGPTCLTRPLLREVEPALSDSRANGVSEGGPAEQGGANVSP